MGLIADFQYYDNKILKSIVSRSAGILDIPLKSDAAVQISRRSRGTPRIANALLRRVRDYAQVKGDGVITNEITQVALKALNVDEHGLDEMDNKILLAIIEKYSDGSVGLNTIANQRYEESGTIEEVYEPFLVQQGYLVRTSRGRLVTDMAFEHLNKSRSDSGQQEIF